MRINWDTNGQPKLLLVHTRTNGPKRLLITVGDLYKPGTYYSQQETEVNGDDMFEISLPLTPRKAFFELKNLDNPAMDLLGADNGVKVYLEEKPFRSKWNCNFNDDPFIQDFLRFISWFAENKNVISAGGSIYKSVGGKFRIKYVDVILDDEPYAVLPDGTKIPNNNYGKPSPTSFRIDAETNEMEASQKYVLGYTIPQVIVLLCHEFSHGWVNRNPASEEEADYHALNITRCLGFGKREIADGFLKVFERYPSDNNVKRKDLILNQLKNMK